MRFDTACNGVKRATFVANGANQPCTTFVCESGTRVLRGSSWRSPFAGSPRSAFRGNTLPHAHMTLARGFRVVLDAPAAR